MVDSRQAIEAKGSWIGESEPPIEGGLRSGDQTTVRSNGTSRDPRRSKRVNGHTDAGLAARVNGAARGNGKDDRGDLAQLARMIEGEIIPRLVLAHACEPLLLTDEQCREASPVEEDVADFARLLIQQNPAEAAAFVEAMRDRGLGLETLLLDVMAPAARMLGDWWLADLCDFADVTIGLSRLQLMLRDLGPALEGKVSVGNDGRRALLTPMPGEQHTFGIFVVEELFRRAGWEVDGGPMACNDELLAAVHDQHYALVGLSVSHDRDLQPLTSLIPSIRKCSCNRKISVIVGGQVFIEHPDYAASVGADATAADGRSAVTQAENLFRCGEECR